METNKAFKIYVNMLVIEMPLKIIIIIIIGIT